MRGLGMTRNPPSDETALIADLGMVLAADPGRCSRRGIVVQDAVNVVLAHIRAAGGPPGLDSATQLRLSRQIRSLEEPLTELLAQRLRIAEPALSKGEALFAAAADARMIIASSLLSLGPCVSAGPGQ